MQVIKAVVKKVKTAIKKFYQPKSKKLQLHKIILEKLLPKKEKKSQKSY